jgi:predicted dehydrogenase
MVRIGLIGCGRITRIFHIRALRGLRSAQLAAIAEADDARREQALEACPGVRAYADYRELLADPDIDAVVICLPTGMHAQCAIDCFRAGKHVYLEKPVATSLEEADEVLDGWRRSGKAGMIGFNFRFNPLYVEARQQIANGHLGQLVCARSVFSAAARTVPAWKRNRSTGGGVLLDLASHHLDIARFLFQSEIESVRATLRSIRVENDTAAVEAQLSNGVFLQSMFCMSSVEEHTFEVYGVKGRLSLDRVLSRHTEIMRPTMPYDPIRRIWDSFAALHPARLLRSPGEPSFRLALQAFADSVAGGSAPSPDLDDGYASLAAVVAAEQSLETGQFVKPAMRAAVGSAG